jgi:hypothetical protein
VAAVASASPSESTSNCSISGFDSSSPASRSTTARASSTEAAATDSSRFWSADDYRPGGPQPSYDKQFVRDWLETQPWPKTDPGPELPADVMDGTRARYVEAFERITGASFARYLEEDVIAR